MSDKDPIIGKVFGGSIRIVRLLGQGGMGAVYEGYQEKLGRKLAVKVMTPEHARNPVAAEYFIREARSASRLRHPNIIQIIDYGQQEDLAYIAMEFVPGRPLTKLISDEFPLPSERVANILAQTLDALGEAHASQIIHRDLKPDNLMIEKTREDEDFVKVLDFGIAKPTGDDAEAGPLTRQGAVVGTPQYMSPEQARGQPLDARSDLFSVGILLYEMLTARLPFEGNNVADILISLIQKEPLAPSARRQDLEIHPAMEAICLRALQKDASLRFASAEEFRDALLKALDEDVSTPEKPEAPRQFIFKRPESVVKKLGESSTAILDGPEKLVTDQKASSSAPSTPDAPASLERPEENEGDPTQISEKLPRRPPERPATESIGALAGAYGIDLGEMEEDLLGESRHVVVLVAHQRARRRLETAVLRDVRETMADVFEDVAREHGAVVQGRRGNQVTLIFGHENMKADDPVRAADAALDLRRRLRDHVHQGITFGFALAQGKIRCPGDDVEAASGVAIERATDLAVVVEDEVIGVGGEDLEARLADRFNLAGSGDPSYSVVAGFRESSGPGDDSEGLLAGRDSELAEILETLGSAARGRGSVAVFSGETGIGKTTMLRRMAQLSRQRGHLVIHGRMLRSGASGLRDLHRGWLDEILRDLGHSAGRLEELLETMGIAGQFAALLGAFHRDALDDLRGEGGVSEDSEDAGQNVRAAFRELIRTLSRDRTVLLVMDDVDEWTADIQSFLDSWLRIVADHGIVVAAGVASIPGKRLDVPSRMIHLPLEPLAEEAARAQLRALVGERLDPELEANLVEMAGGIPLYVETLARHVRERETFSPEAAADWLSEVHSVRDALRQRLFLQPRTVRNVLGFLSVLGSGVSAQMLYEMASSEWKPEEAIQKLYDDGLVRVVEDASDLRLYFDPPAFERVVYEGLSGRNRARIHARAAERYGRLLERGDADSRRERELRDALARHLFACGGRRQALSVLGELIGDLLRGFEQEAAIESMRRWLEMAEEADAEAASGGARTHVELLLARTLSNAGHRTEGIDLLRKLQNDPAADPLHQIEAGIELARAWLETEDTGRVARLCRTLVQKTRESRASGQVPDWLLVHALQVEAAAFEKQGKLPLAAEALFEAVRMVDEGMLDSDSQKSPSGLPELHHGGRLRWEPVNQLGRIRLKQGKTDEARRLFELAISLASTARDIDGEIAARANLSALHAGEGELEDAHRRIKEAVALSRGTGKIRSLARLEHNRALLLMQQMRREEAREAFEQSRELAELLDWREGIALNTSQLRRLEA